MPSSPLVPGRACGDHDEIRSVAVEHEHLRAGQRCRLTRARRLERDPRRVPFPVRLGERERCDRLTARDAREQRRLLILGPGIEDRVGREHHGREVGSAQQRPTHLLEHDAELHPREALAAVGLGDVQALEPQLVGHLRPDRGVVALGRLHQPPHLGLGALGLQELPHGVTQLVLLFGKSEVHGDSFLSEVDAGDRASVLRVDRGCDEHPSGARTVLDGRNEPPTARLDVTHARTTRAARAAVTPRR